MSGPYVPSRKVIAYCLAMMSLATAVIHFAVAGAHFQEYWLYGVFMLVVAWLQVLWAILAVVRPSRLLLGAGVILNVGVIAVYVVTRTVGDVIGPGAHTPEQAGFGDLLCTALEAIVAAGCAWLLIARTDHRVGRQHLFVAPAAVGAVTATLLSVSLVAGGPNLVMNMSASASADAGATSSIKLATTTPAGDITMPDTSMQMAGGMKMASSVPCAATPTAAQQGPLSRSWTPAGRTRRSTRAWRRPRRSATYRSHRWACPSSTT